MPCRKTPVAGFRYRNSRALQVLMRRNRCLHTKQCVKKLKDLYLRTQSILIPEYETFGIGHTKINKQGTNVENSFQRRNEQHVI